jgi:hypothetical protein
MYAKSLRWCSAHAVRVLFVVVLLICFGSAGLVLVRPSHGQRRVATARRGEVTLHWKATVQGRRQVQWSYSEPNPRMGQGNKSGSEEYHEVKLLGEGTVTAVLADELSWTIEHSDIANVSKTESVDGLVTVRQIETRESDDYCKPPGGRTQLMRTREEETLVGSFAVVRGELGNQRPDIIFIRRRSGETLYKLGFRFLTNLWATKGLARKTYQISKCGRAESGEIEPKYLEGFMNGPWHGDVLSALNGGPDPPLDEKLRGVMSGSKTSFAANGVAQHQIDKPAVFSAPAGATGSGTEKYTLLIEYSLTLTNAR